MKLDDERPENHPEEPPPPKNFLPVTIASAVVAACAVITTQLLWPWTAPAIHDSVNVIHVVVTAALLSIRRREP